MKRAKNATPMNHFKAIKKNWKTVLKIFSFKSLRIGEMRLKIKLAKKKKAIEKNEARIEARTKYNIREIYSTNDVRQALDQDPNCSCTKLLRKSNMTPE